MPGGIGTTDELRARCARTTRSAAYAATALRSQALYE